MDDESGESMEPMEEVPLIQLGMTYTGHRSVGSKDKVETGRQTNTTDLIR